MAKKAKALYERRLAEQAKARGGGAHEERDLVHRE
jgi:hypothetical protein